ncbi:MAG TPA: glycerol-3-phosphate dehydrogenase [Candidatus Limnocylindrales bacterium]|nr:glycerol-3-phosphate dehydrogenase [Candidatus Limnocylindrales bacterium]
MRSLVDRTVDLLVIGGGIIGAGIARDAALRGLSVALVEQNDFGSGTSSRPTRLIHGGLRYLELFDFGLVRSDMREREILLQIAPHLVFPLPFLLPLYRPSLWYQLKLRIGMQLYDALSLDKSLPKRKKLSRAATLAAEPTLDPDGLAGSWQFYDAQVPLVERLVVENVIDAAEHGALVLNHAEAIGYMSEGDAVTGARVRDSISGREIAVRARYTVNATGPWLDRTIQPVRDGAKPLLRLTKGIHLVTPHATEQAHVLFAQEDGRLFFVLPWLDSTIVGTTDTDYAGDPADAAANDDDVRYLREAAHRAFPDAPFDEIYFTWAGVRALVREEGVSESQVSRKHALYDHEKRDGRRGLLSVCGGKLTAYRDIAEEVTDRVARTLGVSAKCATDSTPLPGAGNSSNDRGANQDPALAGSSAYLRSVYGSRWPAVAAATAEEADAARLCAHHKGIAAEIVHAVRSEWAMTIGDVLLRRMMLGLTACQGLECLDEVARRMGAILGWDGARQQDEIARYKKEIEPMRRFSTATA